MARPFKDPYYKAKPHTIKVPAHLEEKAKRLAREKRLSEICSKAIEEAQ